MIFEWMGNKFLKKCFKCRKTKTIYDFYKHSNMKDGRLNKCKECTKIDVKKNRDKKIEYYRQYDRERGFHSNPEYAKKYKKNILKDIRLIVFLIMQ